MTEIFVTKNNSISNLIIEIHLKDQYSVEISNDYCSKSDAKYQMTL